MRLEVLIDSEEPIIYPINKVKMIIGSSDAADIIINVDGVSRKHIILVTENDQYSVIDQGSTNGTYINEERLIPGKRVDFTSFFPVRLGDRVLLSLLSDDEDSPFSTLQESIKRERTSPSMKAPDLSDDDGSTKMINLKQLQQSQATKKLTEQRKKVIQDKKAGKPVGKKKKANKDAKRMQFTQFFVIALVAGAIYYQFGREEEVKPIPKVQTQATPAQANAPVQKKIELIPENQLLSYESLLQSSQAMKCTTSTELELCNYFFPKERPEYLGVVETPGFINVYLAEGPFYHSARQQLGMTTTEAIQKSGYKAEEWKRLAYVAFIQSNVAGITFEKYPSKPVNFVFTFYHNNTLNITGVMTLKKENYADLMIAYPPRVMRAVKEYGIFSINPILKYIQIY